MPDRLNQSQTQQRLLDAAVVLVRERGIGAGLEHIPFEDVVKASGVARTSAHRRWPKRERFYAEVLLELARGTSLPHPTTLLLRKALETIEAKAWQLDDPQGHRDLIVELLRQGIDDDFAFIRASREWRSYFELVSACTRISDSSLREQVAGELADTQRRLAERRARACAQLSSVLGYRLVRPLSGPDGFDLMSQSVSAVMFGALERGLLLTPGDEPVRRLRGFGSREMAHWRPATYATVAMVLSFIEPEPGFEWSRTRTEDLAHMIRSLLNSE